MTKHKSIVKVWDPLIRIGHWFLVIAFFTAYLTEAEFMALHVWAGYAVAAYLIIRIIWGFIGSKYARFRNFIYSPLKLKSYLKNLMKRSPQHYVGHNPAGGIMVVTLLLSLAATTLTGLKLYAVEDNKGPLAISEVPVQTQIQFTAITSVANVENNDDESDQSGNEHRVDKESEEFWEELHEFFANLTLLLVFLHIMGVAISRYIDKEKLVKAMFTGKKDIDDTYQ